jgi:transposase
MDHDSLDDWIIFLLPTHSSRQIAQIAHVGRDRVRAVRNAYQSGAVLFHQLGRPSKVTPEIKKQVYDLTLRHPTFSDFQIAQMIAEEHAITISRATINRLRHLAKFKFLPPKHCQKLTDTQRRQRVQFAKDFCAGQLPLQNLVFCDESRFCMGPDNRWVWRRRGEYDEPIFAQSDKYPRISIHLWAAIGVGFKSSLIFFEKTVDSDVYVESLKNSGFVNLADMTFGPRRWYLVQDGASCHTSSRSLDALFQLCNVFPEWPPNSPDLNPIESLWGAIKRRLRWDRIQTRVGAIEEIQRVWAEFDQRSIDSLAASFANRVKMVGEAEGRTIQPLISAGKTEVPPGYADALRSPAIWDENSDRTLRRMVAEIGTKWKTISRVLGDFTEIECRSRWMALSNLERLRSILDGPEG